MADNEKLIAHLDVLSTAYGEAPKGEGFPAWWADLGEEERAAISSAILVFDRVPNGDPMAAGAKMAAGELSSQIDALS